MNGTGIVLVGSPSSHHRHADCPRPRGYGHPSRCYPIVFRLQAPEAGLRAGEGEEGVVGFDDRIVLKMFHKQICCTQCSTKFPHKISQKLSNNQPSPEGFFIGDFP
ncbi:hypothetical protein JGUZn3_22610 [Entomobacter blattae]|uniref:Uncharacterized protein n=1 Tax=Entomobacter blattae TaxID=2762277 RepID=A0A7H1NUK2_9PROT|nr:hypothetical protein JGUZn3_22610 [Entomobacter blattae]